VWLCCIVRSIDDESGINWNDPDLKIDWPVTRPIISEKDRRLPFLSDLSPDLLPVSEA